MSLADKQNSMRFGGTYTPTGSDPKGRWNSISGSYSYDGDHQAAHDVCDALEENMERSAEASGLKAAEQKKTPAYTDSDTEEKIPVTVSTSVHNLSPEAAMEIPSQREAEQDRRPYQEEGVLHIEDAADDASTKTSLTSPPEQEQEHIDPSRHTILIVDDDTETRNLYVSIFKQAQYNVIAAVDGLAGLDQATKQQPDVVFTGIVMPRMDGFTMIESLKKNANLMDVPVVINSHLGRAQDKKRAKEIGARDFIVRDYTSPKEVVDRIDDILSLKKYIIPLDLSEDGYETFIADLGGIDAVACEGGKPALELTLTSVAEKTFTAKLVCDKD